MASPWPDGTKVAFKDSHRKIVSRKTDLTAVHTVRNTEDSLHDVFLEEDGSRWGVIFLKAIDQQVRDAQHELDTARSTLSNLRSAALHREKMSEALVAAEASSRVTPSLRQSGVAGGEDIAATLRILDAPLRAAITSWEELCQHLVEEWLRAREEFEAAWPEYVGKIDEVHHHAH